MNTSNYSPHSKEQFSENLLHKNYVYGYIKLVHVHDSTLLCNLQYVFTIVDALYYNSIENKTTAI